MPSLVNTEPMKKSKSSGWVYVLVNKICKQSTAKIFIGTSGIVNIPINVCMIFSCLNTEGLIQCKQVLNADNILGTNARQILSL
ncbi:Uncharacterised protein [Chlamydia trachomatis]|nr:Uncharacterised protein [Chlamydia trachomatis]